MAFFKMVKDFGLAVLVFPAVPGCTTVGTGYTILYSQFDEWSADQDDDHQELNFTGVPCLSAVVVC